MTAKILAAVGDLDVAYPSTPPSIPVSHIIIPEPCYPVPRFCLVLFRSSSQFRFAIQVFDPLSQTRRPNPNWQRERIGPSAAKDLLVREFGPTCGFWFFPTGLNGLERDWKLRVVKNTAAGRIQRLTASELPPQVPQDAFRLGGCVC